ncbi:MAG: hypothetical protein EAZ66_07725, partial [Alphaproteobacteria bacterium]
MRLHGSALVMTLYLLFLLIPIYWLVNMSFKTNTEITSTFTLFPMDFTVQNYVTILTDPSWYMGYVNSIIYVTMNVVISLTVALPAAYAFSRYNFMGDKHLFFWLLTNRMAPPAVFALPFFQLYSSVGLFDTHIAVALAHCLFNVPLAVWILEGFMRGVPKEIDETAYIDGYSFGRFFVRIFMPLIAAMGGNVGIQSAALVVKALANQSALDETLVQKLLKELAVGLVNGLVCSTVILMISLLFQIEFGLCLTASVALFCVIIFASFFGTWIPLTLHRMKIDPALATGPFVTTLNDIFGLIIYFS